MERTRKELIAALREAIGGKGMPKGMLMDAIEDAANALERADTEITVLRATCSLETQAERYRMQWLAAMARPMFRHGITWATYPNPMRDDGVFVRQQGDNPYTPHCLEFQLAHRDAEDLVRLLNSWEPQP